MKGALLSWYESIGLGILPIDFAAQIQPVMETRKSSTPPVVLPRWPHTHEPTPAKRSEHAATIVKAFPRVFGALQTLRKMEGSPMRIQLADDAKPFAVTASRMIPYSWCAEIKTQLDDLIAKNIIVGVDYPTV